MAITLVADSGEKVSGNAASYTYAFTPGVCDFLYTFVLTEGNEVTATFNGNSLSIPIQGPATPFFNLFLYIFRSAVDPAAGAHNIVITPTTGSQGYITRTISLLGVNRSSPDGATYRADFANAASPFTSSAIATAVGDWLLSGIAGLTDQDITPSADQTNESEPNQTYHFCTTTKPADASSETFGGTYSASMFRAAVGLVVQIAGAGGSVAASTLGSMPAVL